MRPQAGPSGQGGNARLWALATIVILLAGCTAGSEMVVDQRFELSEGQFAEANLRMAEGDRIEVTFSTDGPEMRWDLHRHGPDRQVTILDEGNASQGSFTYTADQDGVVSAFWEPHDQIPILLDVRVTGQAEVVSLVPDQP